MSSIRSIENSRRRELLASQVAIAVLVELREALGKTASGNSPGWLLRHHGHADQKD